MSHACTADPDQAAAVIATARRVLLTGLVNAAAEAAAAACDLAEACEAAVDPGSPETARTIGPLVARVGSVTATAGDLRDRADLVVFWFCRPETVSDLARSRPTETGGGSPPQVLLVGPAGPAAAGAVPLIVADDAAVDLARLVEALIRDAAVDAAACDPGTLAAARDLASAIAPAGTVGFVTDWRQDAVGLAAWSTTSLVRTIAHRKPAFEVPRGERDDAATAVCTWRYGACGGIERADRDGGRFLAAEADAVRLLDRREVDCVVLVGAATPEVSAAIDRRATDLAVVRLVADAAAVEGVTARVRDRRNSAR